MRVKKGRRSGALGTCGGSASREGIVGRELQKGVLSLALAVETGPRPQWDPWAWALVQGAAGLTGGQGPGVEVQGLR